MKRLSVPTLSVLHQEDHQERDDRRSRVEDQLPGIRPPEEWAGYGPHDDGRDRDRERKRRSDLAFRPATEP